MKTSMKASTTVTVREIRGINKIAQQYMTNATLIDTYSLEFSAMELQAAIDVLTRLQSRVAACAAIEKAAG